MATSNQQYFIPAVYVYYLSAPALPPPTPALTIIKSDEIF